MSNVDMDEIENEVMQKLHDIFIKYKPKTVDLQAPNTNTPKPTLKAIENAKNLFPEEIENLLSFEEKGENIIIKPRQFLGSDNFSKIASMVRQVGGQYVSAGKMSHFEIPKV